MTIFRIKRRIEPKRYMFKKLRPLLSISLLLIAVALAAVYISKHHYLLNKLSQIPLTTGLLVLGLYAVLFLALMLKFSATIKLGHVKLDQSENAKLNAHTLLINFFLPGQGGPVYTGLYLYKRKKLRVKNFVLATVLYYLVYAVISVSFLFLASRPWWQTVLAVVIVAAIGLTAARRYMSKAHISKRALNLHPPAIIGLLFATLFQIIIQAIIYGVELKSVNHGISTSQIITYTGAANLALFASLTPGAIGIRESFLIFTEKLNHLSSGTIVLASLIDRSVYLVFLGLIVLGTLAFHVNLMSAKYQDGGLKIKAKLRNASEES